MENIFELLETRCPRLVTEVKQVVEASEARFSGRPDSDSFLWQHTVFTAAMALKIARGEAVDPLLPVVTALFHDCGKFQDGTYHADERPEEEAGAEIAGRLLAAVGMAAGQIRRVQESLLALYNEKKRKNPVTRIVHDADFLVKFGHMGFACFFEKAALRGMAVQNSMLKSMSKELTYAASLGANMFTPTGRRLARDRAAATMSLFRNYLAELQSVGILEYEIREMAVACCRGEDEQIPLILVLPRCCPVCRRPVTIDFDREAGIKCERLTVKIQCPGCTGDQGYDFSFCLPELSGTSER